jgi:hypothetical protein
MRYIKKNDALFLALTAAFCIDSILNYRYEIPLFVALTPAFIAAIALLHQNSAKKIIVSSAGVLLGILLLKALAYKISATDFSDLLLLSLAALSFNHFLRNPPTKNYTYAALLMLLILFTPTFFGIDNSSRSTLADADLRTSTNLELFRTYRSGFYRVPHIAAYALFIFSLVAFAMNSRKKSIIIAGLGCTLLYCSALAGSRVPIISLAACIPIYYAFKSPKTIPLSIAAVMAILAIVLNIDAILSATSNTLFFQYFSSLKTLTSNPEHFSRVIIWQSWTAAVTEFNFIEIIFGRSYSSSLDWNHMSLGAAVWFHNDFLGIFFAYGLTGLLFYLAIYYEIYTSSKIKHISIYVFAAYFFVVFAAITNGMYKYIPFIIAASFSLLSYDKRNTR